MLTSKTVIECNSKERQEMHRRIESGISLLKDLWDTNPDKDTHNKLVYNIETLKMLRKLFE